MRSNLMLAAILGLGTLESARMGPPQAVSRRGYCPDCDEPTIQNATLTEHYCGKCRVVVAQPVFR